MCPECGHKESVLQSVVTEEWECRVEVGGCGAVFAAPQQDAGGHHNAVQEAVRGMTDAIRRFEHQECPLGQPSLLEMERRTAELLEILKYEIGRLTTLVSNEN